MIEIFVLFLGVYGAFSAPAVSDTELDNFDNDAAVLVDPLPGTNNLNEKALPVSRLFTIEPPNVLRNENLGERSQIPYTLPGTKNLAEKGIPEYVIQRMSDPANTRISSHPDFPNIPIGL